MKPLSILIDDHVEKQSFPDLFGGCLRKNKKPLKNYSKVVWPKLLNVDRKFAADSLNLFFKCKVLVQKQITSNIQTVLRKNKKKRTSSDVSNPVTLNKMIDDDQGYSMLHMYKITFTFSGNEETFICNRTSSRPTNIILNSFFLSQHIYFDWH